MDPRKEKLTEFDLADLNVDFGTRPKMEPLSGVKDHHRRQGMHLAAIHRMHLRDMKQIGGLIQEVMVDHSKSAELLTAIQQAEFGKNMRLVGTLCGRECQVLTFHHDAEENMIFPQLEQQNITILTKVVVRLKQEHLIVHELLDRLEESAQVLVNSPSIEQGQKTQAIFDQLFRVVVSHFGYEETELRDALGLFVPVI